MIEITTKSSIKVNPERRKAFDPVLLRFINADSFIRISLCCKVTRPPESFPFFRFALSSAAGLVWQLSGGEYPTLFQKVNWEVRLPPRYCLVHRFQPPGIKPCSGKIQVGCMAQNNLTHPGSHEKPNKKASETCRSFQENA